MNKYELEVFHIGGENLLKIVQKEFPNGFFITASDTKRIILGNNEKNVSFCRSKYRILERHIFGTKSRLERKH